MSNLGMINGGRTRARTWDPLIKSQLLYQLSYAPGLPSAGTPPGARRLAKAMPESPAARHSKAPKLIEQTSSGKAAGRTRRLAGGGGSRRQGDRSPPPPATRSECLTAACGPRSGPHGPRCIQPPIAAMTVPAALAVDVPSAEAGEHDEAVLLSLVQALVERAGRVGEFLQRGAALRHRVGAQS